MPAQSDTLFDDLKQQRDRFNRQIAEQLAAISAKKSEDILDELRRQSIEKHNAQIEEQRALKKAQAENIPESWESKKISSLEYTLPLLAQFEGVKLKAYNDGFGYWTIGIGSTQTPEGKPVTKDTKITSMEELEKYTLKYIEKKIYPTMEKVLPVEKMSKQEIAAVVSFCYNCGAGVLKTKQGNITRFSKFYIKYKETGDQQYLDAAATELRRHCLVNGKQVNSVKNRRDFEARLLCADITLEKVSEDVPSIDLTQIALGSINTVGYQTRLPEDNNKLVSDTLKVNGVTFGDKLASLKFPPKQRPRKLNKQKNAGR